LNKKQDRKIQVFIAAMLVLNMAFWLSIRDKQSSWLNVPPAPDKKYAAAYGLGDTSFAYRLNGLMIQNMGDVGGRTTPLDQYDYKTLSQWFFVQDDLDPISDFTPNLASYYFGAVQKPEKLYPVLDYLELVGQRAQAEKWRWLAQAVYLSRFRIKDKDRALELANVLARTENKDVPAWVKQMPAFIMVDSGEKDAAYALMTKILQSSASNLHPNEIYSTKIYICTKILSEEEAKVNPLCDYDKK